MLKTVTIRAALLIGCMGLSVTSYALADPPKQQVDIPAGDLANALLELSNKYGADLVYRTDQVRGVRTRGVHGKLTTEEAVNQLLRGTSLKLSTGANGSMLIATPQALSGSAADTTSAEGRGADAAEKEGKSDSSGGFRVAQMDQGTSPRSSGAIGTSAASSSGSSQRMELQEVVVTAQKREERLMDVPISIVALSADELTRRHVTTIDDLALVVPGLTILSDTGARHIYLRGISNTLGLASLVGVYLDEADVTSSANQQLDINAYDLQRVEVLRGPQGTLYGEGSVGGTLRFITNSPMLDRVQMTADVAGLVTQGGAPTQRIQAVVNIPLVDNELGLRIAGQFDHEGGWIDQPAANLTDINDKNSADVRAKLLWKPLQELAVSGTAEVHRSVFTPNNGEDRSGNYTQPFGLTTRPRDKDNFNLYNLTLTYDIPLAQVISTTTYVHQNNEFDNEGSFFAFPEPPAAPYQFYDPYYSQVESALTQELRVSSSSPGPWKWTIGGFYRHFQSWADSPVNNFGFPGPPGAPLPAPYGFKNNGQSKVDAVFGDISYELAQRVTLGAGVRYFHDAQTFTIDTSQASTFHSVDPRLYMNLKLTGEVNLYASAAKGFRSGGFNQLNQPTYSPESVWTYEFGSKMTLLDRRLDLDADIFYSDYKDYLVPGTLPPPALPLVIVSNAGKAVIKGIEARVGLRLGDQWTLSINGDYLDAYFKTINLIPSSAPYLPGDRLPDVYRYQGTASLQRDFNWDSRPGFVRLDYSLQGPSYSENRATGPWWYAKSDRVTLVNFSAGLQLNENLSVELFTQNLFNQRRYVTPFIIDQPPPRTRPRTYGFNFGVKF